MLEDSSFSFRNMYIAHLVRHTNHHASYPHHIVIFVAASHTHTPHPQAPFRSSRGHPTPSRRRAEAPMTRWVAASSAGIMLTEKVSILI
jgi:hypothetical protein